MTDDLRIGIGFDAHAFADGRRLVLAGVEIPGPRGLDHDARQEGAA